METKQQTEQVQATRDMSWLQSLLNNLPLLKWVRKFTANKLLDDNTLAEKFGIATNDDSVSVADSTLTKTLTTHCGFAGKVYTKFSMKQLAEVVRLLGDKGELIIADSEHRGMVVQIDDTCVVVCPLGNGDGRGG